MKKIWVVDDEPDFRNLIRLTLEKQDYIVKEIENGEQCLDLLKEGKEYPDLILLDVMMPDLDGWEVCRRIKKNHAINSIPICMLTAKTAPYDINISLNKAHANWHINKPVEREHLFKAIEWLINPVMK